MLPSKRQFGDGVLQLAAMNESTAWKEVPVLSPPVTPQSSSKLALALTSPDQNENKSMVSLIPQSPVLIPTATPQSPYTPRYSFPSHFIIFYHILFRSVKKLDEIATSNSDFDVVGAVIHFTEKEMETTRSGQQIPTQTIFILDSSKVRCI